MKRLQYIIVVLFISYGVTGQEYINDAVRTSRDYNGGTARSVSMGGAFGALGGDFSSISINPAGLGVYRSSEFTFSPELNYTRTDATYFGSKTSDYSFNFNVNNLGYVGSLSTGSDVEFVNFAIGYNRSNTYSQRALIQSNSTGSSMVDWFALDAYLQNKPPAELIWDPTGLAYDAYLINDDSLDLNLNIYDPYIWIDNYSHDGQLGGISDFNLTQRRVIETQGRAGEYVFALGINLDDWLYLGGNIAMKKSYYKELTTHSEDDEVAGSPSEGNYFDYQRNLEVFGTGYTFKLGAIARPIAPLRLGASFHLPSFYKFYEESWASIYSFVDVHGVISHRTDLREFNYRLITPFKAVGSAAFQIEKIAMISADFEYVNYPMMRFRSLGTGYSIESENDAIIEALKPAVNLKAGAEFRIGSFSLRGGGAFYGSPWKTGELNEDAYRLDISTGFGVRSGGVFFDMGFVYAMQQDNINLYSLNVGSANPIDHIAKTDISHIRAIATLGLRF